LAGPTALGGRFDISGTTQDGTSLQATIECARFGRIVAEGRLTAEETER
jgi:hypothetical protein